MKNTTVLAILISFLIFSCSDNEEQPSIQSELYKVSINPSLESLQIIENGRESNSSDSIVFTDISYMLTDSSCNEIDSYSRMINDGAIPEIILPNLSEGKYYYSLSLLGRNNIRYSTVSNFTLESDTTIESTLKSYQMRYRFLETSDFESNEVFDVDYILNFSKYHFVTQLTCPDSTTWDFDTYSGFINASADTLYSTEYYYNSPIDLESVHIKFYDINHNLLKTHITPLVKELNQHYSYTFNVNLSSIWNETESNTIRVNLEEINWITESIDLN